MIGYCTNVRAGERTADLIAAVREFAIPLREALGTETLGIGLWLSARSAAALRKPGELDLLRDALGRAHVHVASINAFPYGDFHEEIVKYRVYAPDWSLPPRAAYTRDCLLILHSLLPEGGRGGVSTLPIGWRAGYGDPGIQRAADAMRTLAHLMNELYERDGRLLHLDIEPEPGCVLDQPQDVVRFFEEHLLREACGAEEELLRRHLRVCHDLCHASVLFVSQHEALAQYARAGIRVGRMQISSAPKLNLRNVEDPVHAVDALVRFAEPRWLHQTVTRDADGRTTFFDDLTDALPVIRSAALDRGRTKIREIRTHFHVPVHLSDLGDGLNAGRAEVAEALALLRDHPDAPITEVETYAWSALPAALRGESMAASAAAEIAFCREVLEG